MSKIASLLVNRTGTVIRANSAAQEVLGACAGVRCHDLLGLVVQGVGRVCRDRCADELALGRMPPVERRGTLNDGRRATVSCDRLGPDVLVNVTDVSRYDDGYEPLTPRERDVLALVAEGLTNRLIGRRLELGPATVRTHMEHVREKLGVRTRAEAVARAMALGILGEGSSRPALSGDARTRSSR